MARPLGSINDGKLYPFKLHKAIQPQDPVSKALLPVKAGSCSRPATSIRPSGSAPRSRLQPDAGVHVRRDPPLDGHLPRDAAGSQALSCAACHDATNRVDFAALGYTPKATRNGRPLCSSCHGPKAAPSFYKLHDKHVRDKKIACAQCHTFSR